MDTLFIFWLFGVLKIISLCEGVINQFPESISFSSCPLLHPVYPKATINLLGNSFLRIDWITSVFELRPKLRSIFVVSSYSLSSEWSMNGEKGETGEKGYKGEKGDQGIIDRFGPDGISK